MIVVTVDNVVVVMDTDRNSEVLITALLVPNSPCFFINACIDVL